MAPSAPWRALALLLVVSLGGCAAPSPDDADERANGSPPPAPPTPRALEDLAWRSHASAPTPRTEVAAALAGDRILVIGGFTEDGAASPVVEAYDVANDAWSRAPDYPLGVHHAAAATVDGTAFVFGGFDAESRPLALAHRFDADAELWVPLEMPRARGAGAAAEVGGRVFLVGGEGAGGELVSAVDVYDPASGEWSTAPDLPTPRDHLAAASLNGTLFVVGGRFRSLTQNVATVEAFRPESGNWSEPAPMEWARGGLAAAAYRDAVVVVGGESPEGTFRVVESFHPPTGSWHTLEPLPTARHGLAAVVAGDRLFVLLGGPRPGLAVSGVVESLGPGGEGEPR